VGYLWESVLSQTLSREKGEAFARPFIIQGLNGVAHLITQKPQYALRDNLEVMPHKPVVQLVQQRACELVAYLTKQRAHEMLAMQFLAAGEWTESKSGPFGKRSECAADLFRIVEFVFDKSELKQVDEATQTQAREYVKTWRISRLVVRNHSFMLSSS